MLTQLKSMFGMPACLAVTLLVILPAAYAQTAPTSTNPVTPNSDALVFLKQVFEQYARATTYHLESVEETTTEGEFTRHWSKTLTSAIVGPGNKFHFEIRGEQGSALQVSDGKTEWVCYPSFHQYVQRATPTEGPGPVPGRVLFLNAARRMLAGLPDLQKFVRSAVYQEWLDLCQPRPRRKPQ
jgi:outer membrane lipoprotein-sorting protein